MTIHFKNISIPFEEIKNFDETLLSDYEQEILLFCKKWLSNTQAFVVHTSGSTGTPQAWTLSREAMQASVKLTASYLGLQANEKALVCLNTAYIAGIMMLVRSLEIGLEMYVVSPTSNPLSTFDTDFQFDFAAFVPLQVSAILSDEASKTILSRAKHIIVGGAAIDEILEKQIFALTQPLFFHTYGMTETISHVALRPLNGAKASQSFTALEGVEISTDECGCLVIASPTTQYKHLITNDIVNISVDKKSFVWIGRADNVINSGGIKVQAETVEKILQEALQHIGLTCDCFVGSLPEARLGENITAFLELNSLGTNQELTIKQYLSSHLNQYQVPKKIVAIEHFQRTQTLKIARKETIKQWLENNSTSY